MSLAFIEIYKNISPVVGYLLAYFSIILIVISVYLLKKKYFEEHAGKVIDFFEKNKNNQEIDWNFYYKLFMISFLFVGVRNGPCIIDGYFRYDDFEFFSTNRTEKFPALLWMTHGDHVLPFYRLEVFLMEYVFSTEPVPYNIFVSLLFVLIIVFSGMLLLEMSCSRLTILLFSVLCVGWINWGEITSGYFCLSVYVQIVLFAIIGMWAYLRWEKSSKAIYKAIVIASIGFALYLDMAGVWVPASLILFSGFATRSNLSTSKFRAWCKNNLWLIISCTVLYLFFGILNLYAFHVGDHADFLSMAGTQKHTVVSFFVQLFYLISAGLLLALVFPAGYQRLPEICLVPMLLVVFASAVFVYLRGMKGADELFRRRAFFVSFVIVIVSAMIAFGRPMFDFNLGWVAKYTAMPYLLFCLLVCIFWDRFFCVKCDADKKSFLCKTIIVCISFIATQLTFDRVMYAYGGNSAGYKINLEEAKVRRENVSELRGLLVEPLAVTQGRHIRVPNLDGKYIEKIYPKLFFYNLSHYVDFVVPPNKELRLYRNKAMDGWFASDVATVDSLRSSVDSVFLESLNSDKYIRKMYLGSTEIYPSQTSCSHSAEKAPQTHAGKSSQVQIIDNMIVESDGHKMIIIAGGEWDPEKKYLLQITAKNLDEHGQGKYKIEIEYDSDYGDLVEKNYIFSDKNGVVDGS